jgi:hypothetical protein
MGMPDNKGDVNEMRLLHYTIGAIADVEKALIIKLIH